jgi:hypothetical protein
MAAAAQPAAASFPTRTCITGRAHGTAGRTHLFQVRECAADTSVRSDDGACAGLDRGAAPVGRRAAVEPCVPRRDPVSARTGWSKDRSGQSDEDGRDCGGDRGCQGGVGAVVRSGNAGDTTGGPTSRWRAPYHPELRGCRPRFESGREQSARRSARFSSGAATRSRTMLATACRKQASRSSYEPDSWTRQAPGCESCFGPGAGTRGGSLPASLLARGCMAGVRCRRR